MTFSQAANVERGVLEAFMTADPSLLASAETLESGQEDDDDFTHTSKGGAVMSDRVQQIERALQHPQFYNGDIGADIRWLLQ